MSSKRVVHYLNQFFAGVGGEDKADASPTAVEGPVGPGLKLKELLAEGAEIVGTVYCGDNYAVTHETAPGEIVDAIAAFEPDVVVAGPAFGSGRYGLSCVAVCKLAGERLGVRAVTGLALDAPGAAERGAAIVVPTTETAVGMSAALERIAYLAGKLVRGEGLSTPAEDGYMPVLARFNRIEQVRAAARAADMVLAKVTGHSFGTEWPLPEYELIAPPTALPANRKPLVALVSEGGLVPKGNPDHLPGAWAREWRAYDIAGADSLTADSFESIHGGIDTSPANADPNRLMALDALRELERRGELRIVNVLYSTCGNMGASQTMQRIASEMATKMTAEEIDAVVVGAT